MKRFFIFLSLLLLTSCSFYKKIPVFQKSYESNEIVLAVEEAYWWMDAFNGDSIPLQNWIQSFRYVDDGYMVEKVWQKKYDEVTEVIITFTSCMCDSTTYHLSVIKRTKDRDQW